MLDYKRFLYKINENVNKSIIINISQELKNVLEKIGGNFSDGILSLSINNINSDNNIKDRYIDYIDIDNDTNMFTYLNSDKYDRNPYNSKNRQTIKPTKIFNKIFKDPQKYKDLKGIDQHDIELFSNAIKKVSSDYKIEEWKGEDILTAFNYNGRIPNNFSLSCANFDQKRLTNNEWEEPRVEQYDIYVKNPKNISVIVVINKINNEILGRRLLFKGKQYIDSGKLKKGDDVVIASNYYGVGGYGSYYDSLLVKWLTSHDYMYFESYNNNGNFVIQLDNFKFPEYTSVDKFYIDVKNGVISYPSIMTGWNSEWKQMYKLKYDFK